MHSDKDNASFITLADLEKSVGILESPTTFTRPAIDRRTVGWLGVAAITYLNGAGGAFTAEKIVGVAGPSVAFITLIMYPLFVTIPYAFIVAELCCAFPEDGGFTVWVVNAFGPFWGFQVGFWSWLTVTLQCAMLPLTILNTLSVHVGMPALHGTGLFLGRAVLAFVMAAPALAKSRTIARSAIAALLVVLVAVVTITICGFVHFDRIGKLFENQKSTEDERVGEVDFVSLINIMFWNFDGINQASSFGGEIKNPARTYPLAIMATVTFTIVTYLFPLLAMMLANHVEWVDFMVKPYAEIVFLVGGKILRVFVVATTVAATVGQYACGTFVQSYQMCGMAENDLLPRIMGRRNNCFGSPHCGVLATLAGTLMMSCFDMEALLPVFNVFAAAMQCTIMLAAVALRRKLPYAPRPVKIPGGIPAILILAMFPAAIVALIVSSSMQRGALVLTAGLAIPGLIIGLFQFHLHHLRCCRSS